MNREEKIHEWEVTVTVEEVYIVKAKHELGAFMQDLGEPISVKIKKRRIKRRKPNT